ncbi:MAG: hypothetical protein HGA87_00145 [Desulfobulbaceae bacterium]|nr:hypothetical protein [Desulfobulbaceae bacterium]
MNVKEIIELALVTIGAIGEGEEATSPAISDGIMFINTLVGQWKAKNITVSPVSAQTDAVSGPDGYEMLLYTNLALIMSPKYGKPMRQDLAALAADAYRIVKHNQYSTVSQTEQSLPPGFPCLSTGFDTTEESFDSY